MNVWEWLTQPVTSESFEMIFVIVIRILLAALLGGAVGLERGFHGRAAGLRTHMLVSIGAALTAMIAVYISYVVKKDGLNSDVQRLSAQVISGIGFLGAGSIILKKGNSQITGLTTAAGVWATASVGLAIGYGLYATSIISVIVIIITFTLMSKLEFRMRGRRQKAFVYIEVNNVNIVTDAVKVLKDKYKGTEIQVTPARSATPQHVGIEALVSMPHDEEGLTLVDSLQKYECVAFALQIQ